MKSQRGLSTLKALTYLLISALLVGVIVSPLVYLSLERTPVKAERSISSPKPTVPKRFPNGEEVLAEVNNWRSKSYGAYSYSEELCTVATKRLSEIKKDFSHNGFQNMVNEGLLSSKFTRLGENLANYNRDLIKFDPPKARDYLKGWLDSQSHKENLLADFTHSCVKCDKGYCVQIFGK